MKHLLMAALLLGTALFQSSCKKSDVPGKGGNATLLMTPQHHGRNIDSLTVYIKYNATNLPSSYDDSAKCVSIGGIPVATFSGLKKGDYYLYGYGWDALLQLPVHGGQHFLITSETTQSYNLAVSE